MPLTEGQNQHRFIGRLRTQELPATAGKSDRAFEIARLLLENGADPTIKNRSGKAPLDYVTNIELKDLFAGTTSDEIE